jgi:hypothetical protein
MFCFGETAVKSRRTLIPLAGLAKLKKALAKYEEILKLLQK